MNFFCPNLGRAGRIFRAVFGGLLIIAGLLLSRYSLRLCLALMVFGIFSLFEAARGWCLVRACGIKTRL